MRVMARWLMAVIGLLAVLSVARLAAAAEVPKEEPATPGIADEVAMIREAYEGRDRGEAASDAAHGQADSVGRDATNHDDGKDPVEPPKEETRGK